MSEIKKPWCTFGLVGYAYGFGKIVTESSMALGIQYTEGQSYSPQIWDPKNVWRFDTLEEAVDSYQKDVNSHTTSIVSDDDAMEDMHWNFPSYFKQ